MQKWQRNAHGVQPNMRQPLAGLCPSRRAKTLPPVRIRGMNNKRQFSLTEAFLATWLAASGIGLCRVAIVGRRDPGVAIVAIAALCCFGAGTLLLTRNSYWSVVVAVIAVVVIALIAQAR